MNYRYLIKKIAKIAAEANTAASANSAGNLDIHKLENELGQLLYGKVENKFK